MINFNNVTKRYSNATALNNVSIEFSSNKIYGLFGRNGAGKTTMLKLIAGHINASSGMIKINNEMINTTHIPNCVHFIESGVSQFNMKIVDLIHYAYSLQSDFDFEFAQEILHRFRLDGNKYYRQLSFGMKTMVTTLLSLSSNSEIVILDEPVLGLDAIMRKRFYEVLADSFENHPRTIIMSTHLIDEIAGVVEEFIILDRGEILLQSSINEIDERAYSITGMTCDVISIADGLNIINKRTAGGFTTVTVFDRRIETSPKIAIRPIGLQEFFISLVEGKNNEI